MSAELREQVARAICCRGQTCRTPDGQCVMDPVHLDLADAALAVMQSHYDVLRAERGRMREALERKLALSALANTEASSEWIDGFEFAWKRTRAALGGEHG